MSYVLAWAKAFVLTVVIEELVAVPLLGEHEPSRARRAGLVLFAQLSSHLAVWFVFPQLPVSWDAVVVLAEAWAVGSETVFYLLVIRGIGARRAFGVAALVGWKLGLSSANAHTITAVAGRLEEFPRCAQGMAEGRLSLDQVGVIAARAGEGSDEHYAELAQVATDNQLRTAVALEPRPEPDSRPQPGPAIAKTSGEGFSCWRITLPHPEAATFEAALQCHRDALFAEWKRDHGGAARGPEQRPPLPTAVEALMRLVTLSMR